MSDEGRIEALRELYRREARLQAIFVGQERLAQNAIKNSNETLRLIEQELRKLGGEPPVVE